MRETDQLVLERGFEVLQLPLQAHYFIFLRLKICLERIQVILLLRQLDRSEDRLAGVYIFPLI